MDGGLMMEVHGLNPQTTDKVIKSYFESSIRSDGGCIRSFKREHSVVNITYTRAETAYRVWRKSHTIDGTRLRINLIQPAERQTGIEATAQVPMTQEERDLKQRMGRCILLRKMSSPTPRARLVHFLESITRVSVLQLTFGDDDTSAVAVFEEPLDIERLSTVCKKNPVNGCQLDVSKIRMSKTVFLKGITGTLSRGKILKHFANQIVNISAVRLNEEVEAWMINLQYDQDALDAIFKQNHAIDERPFEVYIYFEILGKRQFQKRFNRALIQQPVRLLIESIGKEKAEFITSPTVSNYLSGKFEDKNIFLCLEVEDLRVWIHIEKFDHGIQAERIYKDTIKTEVIPVCHSLFRSPSFKRCKAELENLAPGLIKVSEMPKEDQVVICMVSGYESACRRKLENFFSERIICLNNGEMQYILRYYKKEIDNMMQDDVSRISIGWPGCTMKTVTSKIIKLKEKFTMLSQRVLSKSLPITNRITARFLLSNFGVKLRTKLEREHSCVIELVDGHSESNLKVSNSLAETMGCSSKYQEYTISRLKLKIYQGDRRSHEADIIVYQKDTALSISQRTTIIDKELVIKSSGPESPFREHFPTDERAKLTLNMTNCATDMKTKVLKILEKTDEMKINSVELHIPKISDKKEVEVVTAVYKAMTEFEKCSYKHIREVRVALLQSCPDTFEQCKASIDRLQHPKREKLERFINFTKSMFSGNSWIHAANDEIGVIKVFAEQTQTLDTVIQKIVRSLHTDIPKLSRTDDLIQKMSPLQRKGLCSVADKFCVELSFSFRMNRINLRGLSADISIVNDYIEGYISNQREIYSERFYKTM